ncbi:MAG: hypothetical protein K8R18_10370 [Parvibaculum sp.]|uniref:hypothetical protein n=1 Tax=Parvibaculum sp. TaxID=2024848 RepID=UPI0025D7DC67|nr:hypothetical protein [Parvibaculum sp.]MCE9650015.1 hypothetical protein [Parvibaculum sp.]
MSGAGQRSFGWETRFVQSVPLNPFWTGAIVATLIFASYLSCAAWNDLAVIVEIDGDPALSSDTWTALCMALLCWCILSIGEYSRRANLAEVRSLARLGIHADGERLATLEFGSTRASHLRATAFGLLGAVLGILFYALVYRPSGHPVLPGDMTLTNVWFLVLTLGLFAEIFRSLSFLRLHTNAFIRDIDDGLEIDLLDISKLDGLGRIALRGALPWFVTGTIVLLLLLGQNSTEYFLLLVAGLAASATTVFVLPMLRVHRLIDAAKKSELVRLRRAVADARDLFERGGGEADRVAARLAALLALEARVESAREWPLDISTMVRFALYLALPLGSWLGGAVVERVLDILTR